jgi:NitT/TauT family transport system ATP-binding protein
MQMHGRHNLLHIEDVYKQYGQKVILDNIDLSVSKGELVTVVGPSGCGKSTLLRLILGQEQTTKGDIHIAGKPVETPNMDRGIVYQKYSLFPNKTVLDNVLLGWKLGNRSSKWTYNKKSITNEAMDLLDRVKLADSIKKYPHQLSGGMQQRVAVIQALIAKPKILLMDEPFGALDPGTREDIQLLLLKLWKDHNMTIFFVTHDLEEAVFLGTRIVVLSQYYRDNRSIDMERPYQADWHGAKIVADHSIEHDNEHIDESIKEKLTAQFGQLIEELRHEGFDPHNCQHVDTFKLTHQHSFRTLTEEESAKS